MKRVIGNVVGFIILCVLAAALLAGVLVQTAPVKRRLVSHFLTAVKASTGQDLTVDQVRIILPFHLEARHVSISDGKDAWMEVERLSATWQPLHLLNKRLSIQDVHLHNVRVHRLPQGPEEESEEDSPTIDDDQAPGQAPLSFELRSLRMTQAQLRCIPELKDIPDLDLQGRLRFEPSDKSFAFNLRAYASDHFAGHTRLRVEGSMQKEIYTLKVHAAESAAGPVSTVLDLPGFPTADIRVQVQGTPSAWQACLAQRRNEDLQLTGAFEVDGMGLLASQPLLEQYLGQEFQVQGSFVYFPDQTLHLDQLVGRNSHAEYVAWLRFQEGLHLREADIDARLLKLAPLEKALELQLAGDLDARLRYRGMPQSKSFQLQLAGTQLKVEGFEVQDFSLTTQLANSVTQDATGVALLDFQIEGIPVSCSSELRFPHSGHIDFQDMEVDLGPFAFEGALAVDTAPLSIAGELRAKAQSLFPWSDHLQRRVDGEADLDIIFTPEEAADGRIKQAATLAIAGRDLSTREAKTPDLSLQCRLYDLLGTIHGDLFLDTHSVKGEGWSVDHLALDCSRDVSELWRYNLSASGRRYDNFTVATTGQARIIPNQLQITFEDCEGALHGHSFHLEEAATLTLNRLQVRLTPMRLHIDEGEVRATIQDSVDGYEASCSVQALPLDVFNTVRPTTPVSGTLTGQMRLAGSRGDPKGEALFQVHNFRLLEPGFQHLNAINGAFQAELNRHGCEVDLRVTGIDETPVDVRGHLPIALTMDPWRWIPAPEAKPLDLTINAHGELGGFLHLFIPDSNRISGDFDIALHLAGDLEEPQVQGSVALHEGVYYSLHTGSAFKNIRALFSGEGSSLALRELSAIDDRHGNLRATGALSLRQRDLYAFWIEAEIDDCLLVNVPDVRAVFDGRVRLEGSTQEGKLSGKLEVVSADLGIPEEMSSSVPKIDVVYINQPVYEPVPQLFPPVSERWILGLDLNVRAPGQTFVRGRGLTSEWEGEGRLRGSTADPMVYGKLSLVRGDYNFIGRIFTLTHGDVQFNGLPGLSTLNVSAELAMEGLTAEAFLHGPIREPQLRLSSNPSRPVKDILARILFDKEVGDISPLQGLELAQTLLSITSTGKGPDFVGNLRRSIGLDRLDISHNSMDPNEVAVHAGKYIARGVFVSINKAVNSSNNELAIEMRLSDQVKVEGRLGDEVGSKVSLKWKKDY